METLYLVSAVLGSTILVGQIALLAFGFGHHGDLGHDADAGGLEMDHSQADGVGQDAGHEHDAVQDASHIFSVLSFRTVTAAVAFFGLAGMAGATAGLPSPEPLLLALAAGAAAMYGVYYMMRALYRLNCDGAQQIGRAVGHEAVVYLGIPGAHQGCGKIHITLQNRLIEIEAVTGGERLATGATVVVTSVLGHNRVEVAATSESSRTANV
jgi:hypothetical protein